MKGKFTDPMKRMKIYKRSEEENKQLGKEEGARFSRNKPRFSLVPPAPLRELAMIYTYGCQKYDEENWSKGMAWRKVIDSLERHINYWKRGEKFDEESGLHHLAHLAWNAFTLYEYERCGLGVDDRPAYTKDLEEEEGEKENE